MREEDNKEDEEEKVNYKPIEENIIIHELD